MTGGFCNPTNCHRKKTGVVDETVASVLEVKHLHESPPPHSTLEVYNKTPIFIPVGIMEDVAELVTQKILGSLDPGGMES